MSSGGMARFEPYGVPRGGAEYIETRVEGGGGFGAPGIATAYRTVDAAAAEIAALRHDIRRLRRTAASALETAEAERVESARLRAQNLELATQLRTKDLAMYNFLRIFGRPPAAAAAPNLLDDTAPGAEVAGKTQPFWRELPGPRLIEGRGLGPDERDGDEWIDREGDRWRYNRDLNCWEYRLIRQNVEAGWLYVPTEPDGYTSAAYAPYQEVVFQDAPSVAESVAAEQESSSSDDTPITADQIFGQILAAAGREDYALVISLLVPWFERVLAEVGSADIEYFFSAFPGRPRPGLSRDDLMDAANAVSHMRRNAVLCGMWEHWRALQERLEAAAIAAS